MLLDLPPAPDAQSPADREASPEENRAPIASYDVAIVGGGIVGATLACALRGSGMSLAIVEAREDIPAPRRAQAYAFSLASAQVMRGLGLWDAIRPRIEAFRRIHLSDGGRFDGGRSDGGRSAGPDGDRPDAVEFCPEDLALGDDTPADLGYVAEHGVLMDALYTALADAPDVTWLRPAVAAIAEDCPEPGWTELAIAPAAGSENSGKAEAMATPAPLPDRIRARLVVAADGSNSPLRQAAGISTRGWAYWQSCIVAAVRPERHHQQVAYERFQPSGPFAILPLGDVCRIVWTAPHDEARALVALDDDRFRAELARRFGPQMGALELAGDRYLFSVKLMQSDSYVRPRLALAGDAAHACHPVGGQGLNLGIRDAAALAEVLRSAWERGEDLGSLSVLRRYDRWRRWGNLTILGFTDLLDRLFSNTVPPVVWLRGLGLWGLRRVPLARTAALRLMTGQLGRLPDLARRGRALGLD